MSGIDDFRGQLDVSRETLERLTELEALLRKWNAAINLVSPQTLSQVWTRHFLDSAQLFGLADPTPSLWGDLGSGGGFPGLVIGILARERWPEMQLVLVESDKRKCAFLLAAIRALDLRASIRAERIEATAPLGAKVLSARALAALPQLLDFAERHLAEDGVALFPKGNRWREEVALAQQSWSFTVETHPSKTEADAVILKIRGVQRV